MSRQDDFQNTQKNVIDPMTRMYHPPAHLRSDPEAFEEVIREYHRALAGLPAIALEKGWAEVKAEHKTWNWPHFQTIRDACEKYKPLKRDTAVTDRKKDHSHCVGHAEISHPQKAREILMTSMGQLALSLGVGRDLLTEYEVSGRTEFDEQFVRKMSNAHKRNCESVAAMKSDDALSAMYESMMDRERRLFAVFYKKAA